MKIRYPNSRGLCSNCWACCRSQSFSTLKVKSGIRWQVTCPNQGNVFWPLQLTFMPLIPPPHPSTFTECSPAHAMAPTARGETYSCLPMVRGGRFGSDWQNCIREQMSLKSWFLRSNSSVWAARWEFTMHMLVLWNLNLMATPPLLPWKRKTETLSFGESSCQWKQ